MRSAKESSEEPLYVTNYCVSFIDLLGQRTALSGQGLLPPFESDSLREDLTAILKNSVGAILDLQNQAKDMLSEVVNPNSGSSLRASLDPQLHAIWDEMNAAKIETQRWSDGLVSFACLGDKKIKCQMNAVFGLFGMAGTLCLLGLANKKPVRGAIEIAWGVELHPGELYGAAVARAYELESEIAQFPRIVVGNETLKFLKMHSANVDQDVYSQYDRGLAILCLDMLIQDVQGNWFLHYLGGKFQNSISHEHHDELYLRAKNFIHEQLNIHTSGRNIKLAERYSRLLAYFEKHPPANSRLN